MVLGWANRQINKLQIAEEFLIEAAKHNPKLTRAFFELGKVYQATEQSEKAMAAYRKALELVFDEPATPKASKSRQVPEPNQPNASD